MRAQAHFLALLLRKQRCVRKTQVHACVLIDAAQIGAMKTLAGAQVELEVVHGRIDQAALRLEE